MNVEIREDSVVVSGYINAVERNSKPISERVGGKIRTFLERIKAGAFRTSLKRNANVPILLNHDPNRVLASTSDGSAVLEEDNIGLRGEVTIKDAETVQKAKDGKLSGWSFGFFSNADKFTSDGTNELRTVEDLDLVEVSVLDDTKSPAYYGTSIEARGDNTKTLEIRADEFTDMGENTDKTDDIYKFAGIVANIVADTVFEKLSVKEKADDLAEDIAENNLEQKADCGDNKKKERAIDYSEFENRLQSLKN